MTSSASPPPSTPPSAAPPSWRPGRAAAALAAAALALVLLVGGAVAWRLREAVRAEMIQRDAEVLHSFLLLRQADVEASLTLEPDLPLGGELLDLVLEAARLRGVLGVRLVTDGGDFLDAVPAAFVGTFGGNGVPVRQPVARLRVAPPADYLLGAAESSTPVLEVRLPLRIAAPAESFAGEAQFLLDASALAARLRELDQQVLGLALASSAAAALGLAGLAAWAARRLNRGATDLAARQAALARANAELSLAARTAAVGALSGHLVHGLKNPLTGLESFLTLGRDPESAPTAEDWRDAEAAVQRMRALLSGVLDVLGAEEAGGDEPVPGDELVRGLRRDRPAASVQWPETFPPGAVLGRVAHLVRLALTNLLDNARDAAPDQPVILGIAATPTGDWVWTLRDRGPGLPEAVRRRLFLPVPSAKPGGSGLGLALAAQLARAAGGNLSLAETGPAGTVFHLRHPALPS